MRILFVNRKTRPHGNFSIEAYFTQISQLIEKEGVSTKHWFAPYYSNGILKRVFSYWALQNQTKQDIVHVTGDIYYLMPAGQGKRVITYHDIGFMQTKNPLKKWIYRKFWIQYPIKRAHAITCVSMATKNEILRHLPRARRIEVIPTVIDPRFVREDKPFNEACPTILLLGSAPNKNLYRVLKATQGLNVHLSIVAKLDAQALELLEGQSYEVCESIPFEALIEKYRSADMIAMCSTHEGFGMPILEAQATGRVVLTSNCSSMPDVAGAGALLVDPYSVRSIKEGIQKLYTDAELRKQLILEGFKNTQRFLPERVAQQYFKLYQRLLSNESK